MQFTNIIRPSVGSDYAVSKNTTDDRIMLVNCIIFFQGKRLISPGPPRLHATLQ
jgi:hypothetical protein